MMSFGAKLKLARLEQGLSQAELAALCTVSQPTVASWERDSHAPRRLTLVRIAAALGLTPAFFTEDSPPDALPLDGPRLMQVPVLDWPVRYAALSSAPVRRYLPIGTSALRPIALPLEDISMNALGPLGSLIVIDIAEGEIGDGQIALLAQPGGVPILRRMVSRGTYFETAPLRGPAASEETGAHTIRGRAVMVISEL